MGSPRWIALRKRVGENAAGDSRVYAFALQPRAHVRSGFPDPAMSFLRRYRSVLIFAVLLVACSVMVVRQSILNQSRHIELREAFILLHAKGYANEAQRLFQKLIAELEHLPNGTVMLDYQRTLTLVDPTRSDPANLLWRYHWTVSNELEKRSENTLVNALKLAHER